MFKSYLILFLLILSSCDYRQKVADPLIIPPVLSEENQELIPIFTEDKK